MGDYANLHVSKEQGEKSEKKVRIPLPSLVFLAHSQREQCVSRPPSAKFLNLKFCILILTLEVDLGFGRVTRTFFFKYLGKPAHICADTSSTNYS